MGEVSIVSKLIQTLIAFAMAAACAGTLGDLVFDTKKDAAKALKRGGISYGSWNRKLLQKDFKK